MAKEIGDKSDVECNFYQSAEDAPEPRELSSEKKNLMVFDDQLFQKQKHLWIVINMSEEDTATLIISI